ncbi:LacI family DNA-binding transcriptional regulator [Streptomyces albiaxialis]|uniref:LacI family DNA-binding transcriptional regulator n=1 Tax=Streptomyces albiaxialis TaxID=329523 RepID=UPI0031E39247
MADKVTLQQVAAHAGVSRATASLVVRGAGRVSQETRDRVFASMAELGYVYDQVAASLRTRQAKVVGIVVTNIANPFFSELILGLEAEIRKAGFLPLLAVTRDDVAQQEEAVSALQEHRVAGLGIVPATGTDPGLIDELRRARVGHVFMTRYLDGAETSYVGPDDVRGGELAGEHLFGHGCRRVAYLGGPARMVSRRDRLTGLRRAARAAGLDPDAAVLSLPGETSGTGGLELGRRLAAEPEALPDGVLCHGDSVAFGLYRALYDAGLADRLRVIGYDDVPAAALWEPPLTSVSVRGRELGREAARLLLGRIEDPSAPPVVRWRAPELRVRRSCGCHGGIDSVTEDDS